MNKRIRMAPIAQRHGWAIGLFALFGLLLILTKLIQLILINAAQKLSSARQGRARL